MKPSPYAAATATVALTAIVAACVSLHPGPPPNARGDGLSWAYQTLGYPTPELETPPGVSHVPGSVRSYTKAELDNNLTPPDWFPEEHPAAPDVVAHGHDGGATPCAECHMMNGEGFLAVPDLTGLPAAYIVEQLNAFRTGERRSWQRDRPDTANMIRAARKLSDTEIEEAAAYFSSIERRKWIRVVETDTTPATRPNYWGWLDRGPGGSTELLNGRIAELAENDARMQLGDPHVGIVDYVPTGSVARGEALVRAGGKSGLPCTGCHGTDLRGQGSVPALAGRAATYTARMLWDIETGARGGAAVTPMKSAVAVLTEADITNIAAYLASLPP